MKWANVLLIKDEVVKILEKAPEDIIFSELKEAKLFHIARFMVAYHLSTTHDGGVPLSAFPKSTIANLPALPSHYLLC